MVHVCVMVLGVCMCDGARCAVCVCMIVLRCVHINTLLTEEFRCGQYSVYTDIA